MNRHDHVLLIVEDHEPSRRALGGLLKLLGWQVRSAATIGEGLDLLDLEPDCLVLDLMLPDGDGEAVLRAVRERGLKTRVVIATGTGDLGRLEAARVAGADAVVRKPIRLEELRQACAPAWGGLSDDGRGDD